MTGIDSYQHHYENQLQSMPTPLPTVNYQLHDARNLATALSFQIHDLHHQVDPANLVPLSSTTQQLMCLLKPDPDLTLPIHEILDQVVACISPWCQHHQVTLTTAYKKLPHPIQPAAKLHQVLINLAKNSLEALTNSPSSSPQIKLTASHTQHSTKITLTDNGPGVSPTHIPKIFQPGFSTKYRQGGSGLGLASCKNIIEHEFGGTIGFDSSPNLSTTVILTLPIAKI